MMCGTEADTGLGGSDGVGGVVGPLMAACKAIGAQLLPLNIG